MFLPAVLRLLSRPIHSARSHRMLTFGGPAGEVLVFHFRLRGKGSIAEEIVKYQVVTLEVPFKS